MYRTGPKVLIPRYCLIDHRFYPILHAQNETNPSILIVICNESCRKDFKDGRSYISIKIQPLRLNEANKPAYWAKKI
jgi:uncharacterized protein YqjF (DUF2071 family)